jgi:Protein of unknown function (DUF3105)/Caspase domain
VDGTRSALIVASDAYTDPGLRQLRAPASDAQALAAVLEHPEIGGFQVRTLLNQPAHEVTLAVEEFFADRRPDDLLLLHVSCHGVKDEDGELYFATSNTRLRRLGATAVAAEFVNRRMGRTRSRRVVLLLDCCYAGAFERGMTARAGAGVGIEEQFGGRGRAVITASSAMEYAFEGDEVADASRAGPSVFTSALVEGLETGEADRDQDGLVGLDELYDYVYDKVRAATPNQTPGKWTFGVQGDLYIARRSRPVTTPAPLPAELQEAIDSPFAGVRAGIVPELARLLRSRHAGLALAARQALERLTEDDSRMVSAAATEALGLEAQPAPPSAEPQPPPPPKLELSATTVDFGRLPQHGKPPERRVRLGNAGGGALNPRVGASPSWLELRQVGDELLIGVDTTVVGEHEDVVTVASDGGSATIRVQARVDPPPPPAREGTAATQPEGVFPGAAEAPMPRKPTGVATVPTPTTPASGAGRARGDRRLPVVGAMQRQRTLTWTIVAVVAVAAVVAVIVLQGRDDPRAARPSQSVVAAGRLAANCSGVQTFAEAGRGHIAGKEQPADWNSTPATSGDHLASTIPAGVYDSAQDQRAIVHNLEHGYVVIQYKGIPQDQVNQLREFVRGRSGDKLVLAPYSRLQTNGVALTAWRNLEICQRVNLDVVRTFVDDYMVPGGTKSMAPEASRA